MYDSAAVGAALRTARKARRLSIAELAKQAEVSPRLIGEVERGARPHVSLATMLRLLTLVGAELRVSLGAELDEEIARRELAEHRRRTWTGFKSTLSEHDDPPAAEAPEDRLRAVASASQLVYALQRARRLARVAENHPPVDTARLADDLPKEIPQAPPEPLPTFGANGLRDGIDLSDPATLLDLMDDA